MLSSSSEDCCAACAPAPPASPAWGAKYTSNYAWRINISVGEYEEKSTCCCFLLPLRSLRLPLRNLLLPPLLLRGGCV